MGSVMGGAAGYYIGHYLWWSSDAYTSFATFFFNNVPLSKYLSISVREGPS